MVQCISGHISIKKNAQTVYQKRRIRHTGREQMIEKELEEAKKENQFKKAIFFAKEFN